MDGPGRRRWGWEEAGLWEQGCRGPPCLLLVMLCGIGGFSDVYKLRWLEAILSWQKLQEGCFGRPGELPLALAGSRGWWGSACSRPDGERMRWCEGNQERFATPMCMYTHKHTHGWKWAQNFGSQNFAGQEAVMLEDVGPLQLH